MSFTTIPERLLQRAVHTVLADPARRRICTNGDTIQVVAGGMINPYEGPDFQDMAVLHEGTVHIGAGEFHRRASDWYDHGHDHNRAYGSLLLHIVLVDDLPMSVAKWTLVLDRDEILRGLRSFRGSGKRATIDLPVEELQHHALLRLLRMTAEADALVQRLGIAEACRAMASVWFERLSRRRHRPFPEGLLHMLRQHLPYAPLGLLAMEQAMIDPSVLIPSIGHAEQTSIAGEGRMLRRELFVNAILPVCCATADDARRIVLLQWYWGADSVHSYGALRRRFPSIPQAYVWQQQGLLEFMRHHGTRTSVCSDVIRGYGLADTLGFLRLVEG